MRFRLLIALAFGAFLALPVAAKDKIEPAINASSKDAFVTVSTWVRKQMNEGGRYSYVTATERTRVSARLDEMGTLLDKRGDVAQMSDDEKMAMFSSQEEVNAILGKRDNERLICKNVKPIGSNIPVKQCQTAGEMEARRRGDVRYLQRTQNSPQLKIDKQ